MNLRIPRSLLILVTLTSLFCTPGWATSMEQPVQSTSIKTLKEKVVYLTDQINILKKQCTSWTTTPFVKTSALNHTVTTSPFLGLRSAFDASDLIVNISSIHEDLRLLRQRQVLENKLGERKSSFHSRPLVEISGAISGLLNSSKSGGQKASIGLNLDTASLEILAQISPWVTGFMSIQYNNSPLETTDASKLFLRHGFLTLGNLNSSAFYATIGQMFLPFGRYASAMISSPLTLILGRTNRRTVLLGFAQPHLQGSVYVFRSRTQSTSGLHAWGLSLASHYALGEHQDFDTHIGVGYLSTLGDAKGWVFPHHSNSSTLTRSVPAFNIYTQLSHANFSLSAEYIQSVRAFALTDVTFNGADARMSAWQAQMTYHISTQHQPFSVALDYSSSHQAWSFGLPHERWAFVASTSWWKNTIESLEFLHDISYPSSTQATEKTIHLPSPQGNSNTLTLHIGLYF